MGGIWFSNNNMRWEKKFQKEKSWNNELLKTSTCHAFLLKNLIAMSKKYTNFCLLQNYFKIHIISSFFSFTLLTLFGGPLNKVLKPY